MYKRIPEELAKTINPGVHNYANFISKTGSKIVVSEGLLSDWRGYETVGNNCTKIFFYSSFGTLRAVYLFNEY